MKDLIPIPIRKSRFVDWVGSLLSPVQDINDAFWAWAQGIRYNLRFNGQVVYLEHVLNDQYDANLRRIFIDDPVGVNIFTPFVHNVVEKQPPLYLYNTADAKPIELNIVAHNVSELGADEDFVVYVPTSVFTPATQTQMAKLIEKYRIASKRYKFELIP